MGHIIITVCIFMWICAAYEGYAMAKIEREREQREAKREQSRRQREEAQLWQEAQAEDAEWERQRRERVVLEGEFIPANK